MSVPQDKVRAEQHYWILVKGPAALDAYDTLEVALPFFDENGAIKYWDCCAGAVEPHEVRRVVQAVAAPTEACCPKCYGPTRVRYPGGDPENGPARHECLSERCQAQQDEEEMQRSLAVDEADYAAAGEEAGVIADQMIHALPSLARVRDSLVLDIMNSKWHHVARTVATNGFKSIITP